LKIIFSILFLNVLLFSCIPVNTNASYPLQLRYECLDDKQNSNNHQTYDMDTYKNMIFVAKGALGFYTYLIEDTDEPISNFVKIKYLNASSEHTYKIKIGHDHIFSANGKKLSVFAINPNIRANPIFRYAKELSSDILFIHIDKELKYAYIGLKDKGLVIYSIEDKKIKYDYTHSIHNITSVFSTSNSIYISRKNSSNTGSIEVYRKTSVAGGLGLQRIYDNNNSGNIRILNVKENKVSFISDSNGSAGIYDVVINDANTLATSYYIDINGSNISSFYSDGKYKVVSHSNGIMVIDDKNATFKDNTFSPKSMEVYDSFIFATDDKASPNSSAMRIYRFGDLLISQTYGVAPLEVKFKFRALNVAKVKWEFKANSFPSYEKSPIHIFQNEGKYNVASTIYFHSGNTKKEIIPITVNKNYLLNLKILTDSKFGNAPFQASFDLNISNSDAIKSISWNIYDANGSNRVRDIKGSNLYYTFVERGSYRVVVRVIDSNNKVIERDINVIIKDKFKPIIKLNNNINYINQEISMSIVNSYTSRKDRNITNITWFFHNGSFSNQKNVIYKYPKEGIYSLKVNMVDEYNMEYNMSKDIKIYSSKLPYIMISKKVSESPLDVNISLVLLDKTRYIEDVLWRLPDGQNSRITSPVYRFRNEGVFKIQNTYSLSDNTKGFTQVEVEIKNGVDINLTSNVNYGFAPVDVRFHFNGFAYSGIKDYQVDFDDNNITLFRGNVNNFSHIYTTPKTYKLKLTATSNKAHKSVAYKNIHIVDAKLSHSMPNIEFNKLINNQELNVVFNAEITNKEYIKSYRWIFDDDNKSGAINQSIVSHKYLKNKSYSPSFEIILLNDKKMIKRLNIKYPIPQNNIHLLKGWNLISNPLTLPLKKDCKISIKVPDCLNMKKLGDYVSTFVYKSGKWIKNADVIEPRYGIWVKASKNYGLSFYGSPNTLDVKNLTSGKWYLLGSGKDLTISSLKKDFKTIFVYDSIVKYIKNPSIVKSTQGFWGAKH